MIIKNLILSGGGLSSLNYIGCYKYLLKHKLLNNLETIIATSGGALIGLCINLKLKYSVIKQIVELYFKLYAKEHHTCNLKKFTNLYTNYGLFENKYDVIIKIIFKCAKLNNNITFKELYDKTNIELIITGSNLTKRIVEYFNYKNYPDMKIIDAIMITTNIPVLYQPIKYNNCIYCDGFIFQNFPIKYLINYKTEATKDNTLGIIMNNKSIYINSFITYIMHIFEISINSDIILNNNYENIIKSIIIENKIEISLLLTYNNNINFDKIYNKAYKIFKKKLNN